MALRTLVFTLLTALLLAGCGASSAKADEQAANDHPALVAYEGVKPKQIFALTRALVQQSTSVHVHLTSDDGSGPLALDLRVSRDGNARGWIEPAEGQRVRILRIGTRTWYKADAGFLAAHGLTGVTPNGPWARVTRGTGLAEELAYADFSRYTSDLVDLPTVGKLRRVDGRTIGGQLSVGLSSKAAAATMYVSADGSATLLGYLKGTSTYRFSEWNETIPFSAPAAG